MRSDLQIEASRANGSKSRGPVTEEGKIASSLNALKHGLLSETVLLHGECEETFDAFNQEFIATLQPTNAVEEDLVNTMAVARWRRMRTWHLEKTTLQIQMDREHDKNPSASCKPEVLVSLAFSFLADNSRSLDLINRYESRYDRQYQRAFRSLLALRKNPLPTPPAPVPAEERPEATSRGSEPPNSAKRTQAEPDSGPAAISRGSGSAPSSRRLWLEILPHRAPAPLVFRAPGGLAPS